MASRSTTPTANPARSNSPGGVTPGCSAISPPSSAQPACRQPVGHARDELLHLVGVELAGGDVVEEEQRLGPHAHDVVDAHGHEVDPDGVVAARRRGPRTTWSPPRRWRTRARAGGSGRGRRRSCPPNPPMPPRTSGRAWRPPGRGCGHGGVARRDVDTGAGVGGAAAAPPRLGPRAARPGAPWRAPARAGPAPAPRRAHGDRAPGTRR